eukprot:Em0013g914a
MIPIESLCQDWKDGKELLLWAKASSGYCISWSCQSPIIEIPTVQQHFFALGVSKDFKNGAVQNEGKKNTKSPMEEAQGSGWHTGEGQLPETLS